MGGETDYPTLCLGLLLQGTQTGSDTDSAPTPDRFQPVHRTV